MRMGLFSNSNIQASSITVNGQTYQGNNLTITNGKIIIDGKEVTPGSDKHISVEVHGDVNILQVDTADKIQVHGSVGSLDTVNGNVQIDGNVTGDVESINGNVHAGAIHGKVKTVNGDIYRG